MPPMQSYLTSRNSSTPYSSASATRLRRYHKMQKTSGQCHINKTLWLFLLSLLFFPENYQPATSRSPRESWTADGSTSAKTAKHLAVLSLFLAVSVRKDKNREGDTTAANRSSASSDEIRIIPMNITTVDICQFIKDLFRTIGIIVAGRHCGRVLNYPYEALRAAL
jgi:hypothetical protein